MNELETQNELDILEKEIKELINSSEIAVKQGLNTYSNKRAEVGQKLLKAQEICRTTKAQKFNKWVNKNMPFTRKTAYNIIKWYEYVKAHPNEQISISYEEIDKKINKKVCKLTQNHRAVVKVPYINYNNKDLSKQEIEIKELKEKIEELTNDNNTLKGGFESANEIKPIEEKTPCKKLLYSIYTLIDMNPEICCNDKIKEMIKESGLINVP